MARRKVRTGSEVELDPKKREDPVLSVAQDFAALVALFDRQLELLPEADKETRTHVEKARAAAKRGADLSGKLLEQVGYRK